MNYIHQEFNSISNLNSLGRLYQTLVSTSVASNDLTETIDTDYKKKSRHGCWPVQWCIAVFKGQIKPQVDWRTLDSPKKRTNEFVLFAMKSNKANKTNLFVHFLGESTVRQSAFGFIWPLVGGVICLVNSWQVQSHY